MADSDSDCGGCDCGDCGGCDCGGGCCDCGGCDSTSDCCDSPAPPAGGGGAFDCFIICWDCDSCGSSCDSPPAARSNQDDQRRKRQLNREEVNDNDLRDLGDRGGLRPERRYGNSR